MAYENTNAYCICMCIYQAIIISVMLYSLYACTFLLFFQLDDSGSPTDELDPIVKILLNELGSKASTGKEKHFTEQILALLSKEASLSSYGFFF